MSDCIFCKLANGEIPTATLYENEDFRVILDAGPATKGHCLILPKAHYADIYEIPDEVLEKAAVLARKMSIRLTKALACDGLNIVQNNKPAAGQTVFHFHMHLIPRYVDDKQHILWKPGELSDEAREEILKAVAAAE
ncbi:MAG TPA: HIT family protein [Lachnospiraceae bacterium]|nr:HIT family protein [Lachnospiraceae bacterium]